MNDTEDKKNKDVTAKDIRTKLLNRADDIIDKFIDVALGEGNDDFEGSPAMLETAFKAVIPLVKITDDAPKLSALPNIIKGEKLDKESYVNLMLQEMAVGTITIEQCNVALSAIEKATNIIEIQEIVKKLNALESGDDSP